MSSKLQAENPTKLNAEGQAQLRQFFAAVNQCTAEQKAAVEAALPALERLIEACSCGSGQSYKLRDLLYSLFNGQGCNLNDVQTLDWSLRKDLAAVILGSGSPGFPDHLIRERFKAHHLDTWFLEAANS
jgi:hypothetical protein